MVKTSILGRLQRLEAQAPAVGSSAGVDRFLQWFAGEWGVPLAAMTERWQAVERAWLHHAPSDNLAAVLAELGAVFHLAAGLLEKELAYMVGAQGELEMDEGARYGAALLGDNPELQRRAVVLIAATRLLKGLAEHRFYSSPRPIPKSAGCACPLPPGEERRTDVVHLAGIPWPNAETDWFERCVYCGSLPRLAWLESIGWPLVGKCQAVLDGSGYFCEAPAGKLYVRQRAHRLKQWVEYSLRCAECLANPSTKERSTEEWHARQAADAAAVQQRNEKVDAA